jgi:hypothetical protein
MQCLRDPLSTAVADRSGTTGARSECLQFIEHGGLGKGPAPTAGASEPTDA